VSLVLIAAGLALVWLAKQALGPLIGQQVSGSVPEYTASKAKAAARMLPSEVAADYEETWMAELEAMAEKPFSAIRYARGLRRAARSITAEINGKAAGVSWWTALSRALDLNVGFVLLLFLSPLLSAIGLALRLDSPGPALIRRSRLGKGNERFSLVCFRTFSIPDRGDGPISVKSTQIGQFLERRALDTLPYLFNLLRGDISLIGPPPQVPWRELPEPLQVRPGMFSWETLVEGRGVIGLSLEEARRRDRQRTFKSDVALLSLLALQPSFASRGRR
jgi:lipopolysaccharide/colanic/teichoic acid biosynthesis glycosyltransferase